MKPIIKLNHITKKYPGVIALNDVSFEVIEGEVHALAGENGAGKSTLIKTISGAINPTGGTMEINGKVYSSLTPMEARNAGVSVIYQEFNLVNELSIADNIFLGEYLLKGFALDRHEMYARTKELFAKLNVEISPNKQVKDLSVAYQQMVEIAKAISKNAKLLIMDEPSAPLTSQEVEDMFRIVRALKKVGVTIIYITHRLDEIFRISDRVSVMRDGSLLKTMNTCETTEDEIVRLMIGRELKDTYPERETVINSDNVLELKSLTGNGVKDISLCVKRGEILGIGGLVGAGRTQLAEMLFGIAQPIRGNILINGKKVVIKNPRKAIECGIALVPEDRKKHGVLLHLSIEENIAIPILPNLSVATMISKRKVKHIVDEYVKTLNIKTPSMQQTVKNLSGGNQQKVVLAKWLATNPDIVIFDEPTRGIDVGAKYEIYKIIADLAKDGKSIIMISSDMAELIGISDRIAVLRNGRLTGILDKCEFEQEKIMRFASLN